MLLLIVQILKKKEKKRVIIHLIFNFSFFSHRPTTPCQFFLSLLLSQQSRVFKKKALSLVGVPFSRRTIDSSLLLYARVFPAAFTSYALVCGFSLALWGAEPSPSLGHTPPRCSAQLWVFLPHCGFSLPCSGLFSLLAWVFLPLSGCIR